MKLKHIFISVFLLFVYALAFAHNMMPHEHGFFSEHQPEAHKHEHHSHDTSGEDIPHLHHNDHCDEGIVDLILCVLNDIHPHHNDCTEEYFKPETKERLKINPNQGYDKLSDFGVLLSKNIDHFKIGKTKLNYFDFKNTYDGIYQNSSPLRGPPQLFL